MKQLLHILIGIFLLIAKKIQDFNFSEMLQPYYSAT